MKAIRFEHVAISAIVATSGLASILLAYSGNAVSILTTISTLIPILSFVMSSLPKGPNIRMEKSDFVISGRIGFGLNVSYHHELHFFNYGNADGQLLSVSLNPKQQIPQMTISTRPIVPQSTVLPTVIPSKQRATLEVSVDTNANPGQSPPQQLDVEIGVKFEVSTNKGPRPREDSFRFRTQN